MKAEGETITMSRSREEWRFWFDTIPTALGAGIVAPGFQTAYECSPDGATLKVDAEPDLPGVSWLMEAGSVTSHTTAPSVMPERANWESDV